MSQVQEMQILPASFDFLQKLKKNNNRDWFNARKDIFQAEQVRIEFFADGLLAKLSRHDLIENPSGKSALHRMYRDTRFSTDKTPYKARWSGSFKRATKARRGGYHFNLQPGASFIAGGFWGPSTEDLKRIRNEIAFDAKPLRKILARKKFVTFFGALKGEQLKTCPKGFDATDSAIDLLRFKQFLLVRSFSDKEVLDGCFLKEADLTFQAMRPFLDFMTQALITDSNGNLL